MLGLLAVIFRKFVRELWPLIDVGITLPLNILRFCGLLLHARHCSGAIVRFSDNSSWYRKFQIFISWSSQLISSLENQICFAGSFKEKSPANGLIMCVGASGVGL